MSNSSAPWICLQIGSREHYSIPAMFAAKHELQSLITDIWCVDGFLKRWWPASFKNKMAGRYSAALGSNPVYSNNLLFVLKALFDRLQTEDIWSINQARNVRYQKWAAQKIRRIIQENQLQTPNIFAYSYAANRIFSELKSDAFCYLGQIDPAKVEQDIVIQEHQRYPEYNSDWLAAPDEYWEKLKEEWDNAHAIIVNSEWSRLALLQQGVKPEKLHVIPLIMPRVGGMAKQAKQYPDRFTHSRPLRVLFLGAAILRKGIARLLEAAVQLVEEPIEIKIVGYQGVNPPQHIRNLPNVQWQNAVSRLEVSRFYRDSDLFVFPTLSDGFGMTQLEAMAHALPVVASKFCGDVVTHEVNGEVLADVEPETIAQTLRTLSQKPEALHAYSQHIASTITKFSQEAIYSNYVAMERSVRVPAQV
jgi:glycosyltransferase involved in cell wall biosynthesis